MTVTNLASSPYRISRQRPQNCPLTPTHLPDLQGRSYIPTPRLTFRDEPADSLGVGGLLPALVTTSADGLVVSLVPEPLADLLEHGLGHVLGHQGVVVGVDLAGPGGALLGPVLVGLDRRMKRRKRGKRITRRKRYIKSNFHLVVIAVVVTSLLRQAPLLGVLVSHLATQLALVLRLVGDAGRLPGALHTGFRRETHLRWDNTRAGAKIRVGAGAGA